MRQVALVIVACILIFLHFGCEPGTPVGIGLLLALVGARWFAIRAIRRRRSNLPVFDYNAVGARLAQLASPKWPNRRETLLLAAIGTIILAVVFFVDALPGRNEQPRSLGLSGIFGLRNPPLRVPITLDGVLVVRLPLFDRHD
jgi:hypothetical protein